MRLRNTLSSAKPGVYALLACLVVGGCSTRGVVEPGLTKPGVAAPAPNQQLSGPTTDSRPSASQPNGHVDPASSISDSQAADVQLVQHCQVPVGGSVQPAPWCSAQGCATCMAGPHGYADFGPISHNPQGIDPNEFLCNGGDRPPAARARYNDQFVGVDLEDTVVRYTTDAGNVHVQESNRVCLYAPRFASVRKVTGAESGGMAISVVALDKPEGPIRMRVNEPGLALTGRDELRYGERTRGPDAIRARDRGVPIEGILQPEMAAEVLAAIMNLALVNRGILIDLDEPLIRRAALSAITWSIDQEMQVVVAGLAPISITRDQSAEELTVYELPDAGRLRICKLADKSDALPGEIVTFVIRVDNIGDSAVDEIVLTDSLTTRLEYVEDSQSSTVEAEFSYTENVGQSLQLTWKLASPLKVGEGAKIEFRCRVR